MDGSKVAASFGNYDEVDEYLSQQDGKIVRKDATQMCRHGPRQKCSHCLPIDVSLLKTLLFFLVLAV